MIRAFLLGGLVGAILVGLSETIWRPDPGPELAALERWERVGHHAEVVQRAKRDSTATVAATFRGRWRGYRVDTLFTPGHPDTVRIPVAVLATADSTIAADSAAEAASDTLVGMLLAHADSADRRADLWRAKARGPFFRKSVEVLFADGVVWGAAEVTAGRKVAAVARVEVDSTARFLVGVRVEF